MRSKPEIYIAVTSDLTTDQRVLKIAGSFHRKGWKVVLIGRLLPNSKPLQTSYSHQRMRLLFKNGPLFYAEFNIRLFLILLTRSYNTVYANDTDTLPACYLASRIRRKNILFDAHELFPEVPELHDRPFVKKVWQKLEDLIIPKIQKSITVCDSIARFYNNRYGINMQVIRNVPYLRTTIEKKALPVADGKKIILYQGALNTGRGLEWVIEAMPLISNAILYIIGDGDIGYKLKQRTAELGLNEKVLFHGKVPADELHLYTASADIGLCLLENKGLSYYYALPNRIFDYMHAGVPVLSSPLPEIKKIVETYNTGVLTSDYSPEALAATINSMLSQPFPNAHFSTISEKFCWEKEEELLWKLI
jgi:glycosyltransferase involved in cell wall biosynthesis